MFSSPQKRGGASTLFGTPNKRMPVKGLFIEGVWHCNCNPRLPASNFQVKKEGANTGRWFYTCQESKDAGCGFFLWGEEAKAREERAVLGNVRSEVEVGSAVKNGETRDNDWIKGLGKSREEDKYGKRSASPSDGRGVDSSNQEAVARSLVPQTPRKAAKTTTHMTPGSKRTRDAGAPMLPTPFTGASGRFFNADAPADDTDDDDIFSVQSTNLSTGVRSPSATPTPGRFYTPPERLQHNPTSSRPNWDIVDSVLGLLKDQHLSESTTSDLKSMLEKHALRVSGIAKGRDITRVALKAKDAKIVELQQRIGTLEAERVFDKTVIRQLKRDKAESLAKKDGGIGET